MSIWGSLILTDERNVFRMKEEEFLSYVIFKYFKNGLCISDENINKICSEKHY